MSCLGIQIDRRNLAVPRIQHTSRSQSMKDEPLLRQESEYRDLLAMRRDVAAQRVFTTDICDVSEAGDAGTRNDEGINWYVTVSHQAARASLGGSKVSLSKEVGGSLTFWKRVMETSRRGTATKGLASGEDTGVWLASVADADDEGAYATVSLDNQAGHDEGDPVHIESRVHSQHESGREMDAIKENKASSLSV